MRMDLSCFCVAEPLIAEAAPLPEQVLLNANSRAIQLSTRNYSTHLMLKADPRPSYLWDYPPLHELPPGLEQVILDGHFAADAWFYGLGALAIGVFLWGRLRIKVLPAAGYFENGGLLLMLAALFSDVWVYPHYFRQVCEFSKVYANVSQGQTATKEELVAQYKLGPKPIRMTWFVYPQASYYWNHALFLKAATVPRATPGEPGSYTSITALYLGGRVRTFFNSTVLAWYPVLPGADEGRADCSLDNLYNSN